MGVSDALRISRARFFSDSACILPAVPARRGGTPGGSACCDWSCGSGAAPPRAEQRTDGPVVQPRLAVELGRPLLQLVIPVPAGPLRRLRESQHPTLLRRLAASRRSLGVVRDGYRRPSGDRCCARPPDRGALRLRPDGLRPVGLPRGRDAVRGAGSTARSRDSLSRRSCARARESMRCPSCASGLPSGQLIPPGAAEPPLPPPGQLSLRARVFGTCGVSPDRCASSGVVIAVRVGAAPSAGDGFRRATCPLCRTACRPAAGAHLAAGWSRPVRNLWSRHVLQPYVF